MTSVQLLRQFEALLGISMDITKRDVSVSPESAMTSCSNQPINPTLTSPLRSVSPNAALKKPISIIDYQAPSAGQEDQDTVCSDSVEEGIQKEETGLENKDRTTESGESSEPHAHHPRLSLFSGMELINRGKPVCLVEPVPVEPDTQKGAEAFKDVYMVKEKSSERTTGPSSSSSNDQVSAFSFLNL